MARNAVYFGYNGSDTWALGSQSIDGSSLDHAGLVNENE